MKVTILGGRGFVGRALSERFARLGLQCNVPSRGDESIFEDDLGVLFYCIGLTADFRGQPFETVEAHVTVLKKVLENASFDRLIYLSSTRVYAHADTSDENEALPVSASDPSDLYNLSKLMGESLALSSGRNCCVARLSNIVGPGMGATNFLGSILADARRDRRVLLRNSLSSSKDYLWIGDAVRGLQEIAERGSRPIYNLASGRNTTNEELASLLAEKKINVEVDSNAPTTIFPSISIQKLTDDTGFAPKPILPLLSELLDVELEP